MKVTLLNLFLEKYMYLFIGCAGSSAAVCRLSLVVEDGGHSVLWYSGFSL